MNVDDPRPGDPPERLLESILNRPEAARRVAPGLFSVLPEASSVPYDRQAALYDAVVGLPLYHRGVWGTSSDMYAQFARAALEAAGGRHFAEIGCGSLLFTAPMYQTSRGGLVTLIDLSLQMLRRALKRLSDDNERLPDGLLALHADAAALPIRPAIFSSVLCLNLLHLPCDAPAILAECRRILIPGQGRLFLSSLVRSGRWADRYMSVLQHAGELAAPRTVDDVQEMVVRGSGIVESTTREGNMCFLVVRYPR
jgi:ubiquinone/menaquinone biosynthesis C-methylase UbiE